MPWTTMSFPLHRNASGHLPFCCIQMSHVTSIEKKMGTILDCHQSYAHTSLLSPSPLFSYQEPQHKINSGSPGGQIQVHRLIKVRFPLGLNPVLESWWLCIFMCEEGKTHSTHLYSYVIGDQSFIYLWCSESEVMSVSPETSWGHVHYDHDWLL